MFVHLNLHSEYSIKDGIIRVDKLCAYFQENRIVAVAITDWGNLYASIKLYKKAISMGIKPIIGCELNIIDGDDIFRITVLCKDTQGYQNLCYLIAQSHISGLVNGIATVKRDWVKERCGGLIILSGGMYGDVGRSIINNDFNKASSFVEQWQRILGDNYYIELHRVGLPGESIYNSSALNLAKQYNIACVATNLVRFQQQQDYDAHEARVCIHQGYTIDDNKRPRDYTDQQYIKTPQQMQQLFADLPQAIKNTLIVAQRCNFQFQLGKPIFPNFDVANADIKEIFHSEAANGLEKRLLYIEKHHLYPIIRSEYTERLLFELDIICSMGFIDYFLVVADFINWAKQNDIPVGPGRGSGAGSLVAYSLGVTELDPIKLELLFERFLNPERVSLPDFDIDFCMDKRDRVIEYVAKKYGEDCVSQIITYGSMAAKAVVRDVGRIFNHPYGFVDKIAKCIPFDIGMTLDKALDQSDDFHHLYTNDDEVKSIIDMAKKLEGVVRNVGKHAGGVVIAPLPLTSYIPLYSEQEGLPVSGFDKNDTEDIGLVKFDFLGLRTLTIIDWTLKSIRQRHADEKLFDINAINLDDKKTFALLKKCQTSAVFQLESRGMKDLIKRLQPDSFEDIIALVALFRPGPLQSGMVDSFVERKHGREEIEYLHPELENILQPTYGVILYQEQVMQIAQVLAGYSLGDADLLRRAMGKKKAEEMAKHRKIFVDGSVNNNVDKNQAEYIFDLMEKFAGYGFNKSHSAAYALIAYQTAWLKAHYPAEFMAAVLSSDLDNTDKIILFVEECKRMGIAIESPDINSSFYAFTVKDATTLRYGLGSIKGIGKAAVELIAQEREHGDYTSLLDLCKRIDLHILNKRCFEPLIYSGACDSLKLNRASLIASFSGVAKYAEKLLTDQKHGQKDLFGVLTDTAEEDKDVTKQVAEWPLQYKLEHERLVLGWYCSSHPIHCYTAEISQIAPKTIATLLKNTCSDVVCMGLLSHIRTLYTKKGDKMAILTIEDADLSTTVTVFPDLLVKIYDSLTVGKLLVVKGDVKFDKFSDSNKIVSTKILTLEEFRLKYLKSLHLHIDKSSCDKSFIQKLYGTLQPHSAGKCKIKLHSIEKESVNQFEFSDQWNVLPNNIVIDQLQQLCGFNNIIFDYFS